jgi:hypothetical protein
LTGEIAHLYKNTSKQSISSSSFEQHFNEEWGIASMCHLWLSLNKYGKV